MARRGPARRGYARAAAFVSSAALCAGTLYAQTQLKGDPERGAARATACAACHGTEASAPQPGTPWLAGQQAEFLLLQLILMREGLREIPAMAGVLNGLADRDLADLAAHFAAAGAAPNGNGARDAGRFTQGAAIAQDMGCGSCHARGYGGQRQVPRLANQREDYLAATMKEYRDNRRTGSDTSMNAVLYQVPDRDIEALAHYLAHQ